MKYLLIMLLCLTKFTVSAQKSLANVDTVYYILDTLKTPIKDRMWDVGIESRYKYFSIKCTCLKYDNQPTFVYELKDPGQKVTNDYVLKLNSASLSTLIVLAKKVIDLTAQTLSIFYLIEKGDGSGYIIHKMRLLSPKKREVIIDHENIPAKEK